MARLEDEIRDAWARLRGELDVAPGSPEEIELAWLVVDDPGAYDWRTVDGAVDRLTCPDCGQGSPPDRRRARRASSATGCGSAPGSATDRTCRPATSTLLRVATAVTRSRHRYSPRARVGYELVLPDLLAGALPTTPQAQAAKALINTLTDDECDRVASLAEVAELARGR
ncbi:hypothetical protein V2I01_13660 [Micromonospora sp. BRA006-A]|nr:hypothetical protein [Micromonospora sp. BRA006-A]